MFQETSKLTIFSEYGEALQGLATFSHIVVFYWLHRRDTEDDRRILRVNPKRHLGAPELGVFATRSPVRPNPIAFEVCRLVKIEGCNLYVKESDAYEGTPIIDIKPYMPRADAVPNAQTPSWAAQGPKT